MKKLGLALVLLAGCNSSSSQNQPLVSGLRLTQIAGYQALKATLMKDGAAVDPEVPIVVGRPLTLRAFVALDPSWDGREVIVRADLTANGAPLPAVEVRKTFLADSTDDNYDSTANLELTADQVTADLTYQISLHETKSGPAAHNDAAVFPLDGQLPMGPQDSGDGEHIVVIPIQYDADGSGRLPDTSDAAIEALRARMAALYPVGKVEVTVGKPLKWSTAVQASGRGWGRLLDTVINKRISDKVAKNVYYYGMFAPAATFEDFCTNGCVLGLSPASADPDDEYQRGSIGVGYPDKYADSPGTFVHEVGHAHGREHAPCGGADGPDRNFPYSNGGIGDWGFDQVAKTLLDPAGKSRDMMGYCSPAWISDYNYKALFDRITYLNNKVASQTLRVPTKWRTIVVEENGEAVRSSVVTLPAGGQESMVHRVGARGATTAVPARFYPFDHIPGGILMVPEAEDTGTLSFKGVTIR